MAYATLSSRIQMLEYLLQLPCIILDIKNKQAEAFKVNVDRILNGKLSLPVEELTRKIEALASTVDDFILTVESEHVSSDIVEIMQCLICYKCRTSKMVQEKLKVLESTPKMVQETLKFLDDTEANWRLFLGVMDVRNIKILLPASSKLKTAIAFFYELAMETRIIYQDLRFLLPFLDKSSSKCNDHELKKSILDVVNGAGDVVEQFVVDYQNDTVTNFVCRICGIHTALSAKKSSIETTVKRMFDRKNGIRKSLWEALKKVHYIKGRIENINGNTLELKALESGSISLPGSKTNHNSYQKDIVIGLDDDITKVTERLTWSSPPGREVLTIMGMGGIGKTTLARKVFDHFYRRAWVTVSQVYHVKELFFRLLCSISLPTYKMDGKSIEDIAEDLRKSLKGQRYLIVMDDVWSAELWDAVQGYFPDDKNGSRILLTSRSVYVAGQNNHYMRLLDNNSSWKLLERVIFEGEICPSELMEVGMKIARKCQGLPIVVIGGLLSQNTKTHDYWNNIENNVSSLVDSTDPEQCLDILALSYNYLPHHLKACFLYLGAFPEDCDIEVHKLTTIWMAEGFLDPTSSKDLEQVAYDCLEDLVGRNLVLAGRRNFGGKITRKRTFGGKIKTCHLHHFLRELCLREAEKENFMRVIKRGSQNFPTGPCEYRLSFHVDPYKNVTEAPSIPQVQSFMCFTLGSDIVPDALIFALGFKLLRVLDIYFLHFDYFPSVILKLVFLKYLALNITYKFPRSLSKFRNLQTLFINGPWPCKDSEERPTELFEYWNMQSLRHLHSSVPSCLKKPSTENHPFPFAPRYLQTLSTLTFGSCSKELFTIIPHLKKIVICETKEDYWMDRSSKCLDNLVYLQELEILKCLFCREKIEKRTLCWDAFPSNIRKLTLSSSYLSWKDMSSVTKLPHLEVLKLKDYAFQGPNWELTEEVFQCLKMLLIEKTDLVHWETSSTDHFPLLEHLVLRSCVSLEGIPLDVGELPTISRIELDYCSTSAENSAREFREQNEGLDVNIRSDWYPSPA